MLMLTDLIRVAMGSSLQSASPLRYGRGGGRAAGMVVVWNVCRHCNMTCPHCYVSAGLKPSPGDLDTQEAERVIDDLADAGVSTLIVSGGEPLLRADVLHLIAYARARGLSVQLSSNGVLIDAQLAGRLKELGVGYVGVSIDGPAPFNDGYRGLAGGYERAVLALDNLRAAGVKTGVRITLTRRNLDALPAMLELARDKADRFYVSHLVYAGRALRMMNDDLSPAQTRSSLLWLFGAAAELLRGGRSLQIVTGGNDSASGLFLRWVMRGFGCEAEARVRALLERRGGNSAGEKLLNIDHRGAVHPDQFWQSATLGRLPRQSLAEVLSHPLLAELSRREERLTGRCATCSDRALCRGSHRERAEAAHGDLWGPDPACVLTDAEIGAARAPSGEGAAHV